MVKISVPKKYTATDGTIFINGDHVDCFNLGEKVVFEVTGTITKVAKPYGADTTRVDFKVTDGGE